MIWTYGAETPITTKILPGFRVETDYAFRFGRSTNGGYYVVDRGADSDRYGATIGVAGKKSDMLTLHNLLCDPTRTPEWSIELENNERIWGPHCDIATYAVVIREVTPLQQLSFDTMAFSVSLLCGDFVSDAGDSPELIDMSPEFGYVTKIGTGNIVSPLYNIETLNGGIEYYTTDSDEAVFEFKIQGARADIAKLVLYHEQQRGQAIDSADAPTLKGVTNPFGLQYTWPCDFRILSILDYDMYAPDRWRCTVTIARDK